MEARLKRNNNGNGYFVGIHPTRADFHVFVILTEIINKFHPELIDQNGPKTRLWLTRFRDSSRTLVSYLETLPLRDL